ncbi:hypothetical protein [Terrisporobacter glycolicus]|uniref:hypothetical protein n=1 Tax=Terrisporobacter glycolicus TaxID=36841 RepID=UPI003464279C
MISFSKWSFSNAYTLENIIDKICDEPEVSISDKLKITSSFINSNAGTQYSNIKNLNIVDKDIRYIYIKLTPEGLDSNSIPDMDILIYELDNDLKIIAFRGFTTANKILKYFFKNISWGSILSQKPDINEDLLYWMFKLIIEKSTKDSLDENNILYIHSLKRYRGSSKDQGNTLTGEGDRISDILGTWAFLLDNDVKLLKTRIIYKSCIVPHSLIMQIQLTGTLKFDINSYSGEFVNLYDDETKLIIASSILITEFIMPLLINSYQNALNDSSWCPPVKLDFIDRISRKIIDRVSDEVIHLKQAIQQISVPVNAITENITENDINDDINDDLDIDDIAE